MRPPKHHSRTPRRAAGFTLLEVVVALMLLAICLVPAANALRAAAGAPAAGADAARNLDCVSALMETVLAEPYSHLLPVAKGTSAYPIPADGCPARTVSIALYGNNTTGKIGAGASDEDLLSVTVALAKTSGGNAFTFTTLVAR